MAVEVFRCNACRREVLVRQAGPMSEAEIARRVREEFEPATPGPRSPRVATELPEAARVLYL